jgi:uncharacterized Tic20 family protein
MIIFRIWNLKGEILIWRVVKKRNFLDRKCKRVIQALNFKIRKRYKIKINL